METLIQLGNGLLTLVAIACVGWVLWRWLKKSEDPARLLAKWILSAVLVGILVWVAATNFREGGGYGAAFIIGITCAIVGIGLGLTWGTNIATFVASPLTNLFDGGTEEWEPRAVYSIAEAKRKQGQYALAVAEIRKQLDRFPHDFTGTLLLADIQAENLNDLPGAQSTIERFVTEAKPAPAPFAAALNHLADLHLRFGRDPDSAREAFQRILDALPDTEQAYQASQRIAHLSSPEMLADRKAPHKIQMRQFDDRVGLRLEPAQVSPPSPDPASTAAGYLAHLQNHPRDAEVRERLAMLYADEYQRLDLALDQIEELIAHPHAPQRQVVRWLNLEADLHLKLNGDVTSARMALQRIIERYPKLAAAETARNRMVHLPLEARSKQKSQAVRLGSQEPSIGLRGGPNVDPGGR